MAHARNYNYNYCRQHFRELLNMDMWRNRPSYEYKSSFWPLLGIMIIIVMVIVARARNYNYNNMFVVHARNYNYNF